jgi:hypothetical protein
VISTTTTWTMAAGTPEAENGLRTSAGTGAESRVAPTLSSPPVAAEEMAEVITALDARTASDQFLSFQEGHLKVCLMETLLDLGFTLQEGCPVKGQAWYIRREPGPGGSPRLVRERGARTVFCEGGSSDVVTIRSGIVRQYELKTRTDNGTKSGAATPEICADLDRVASREGFVFLSVLDEGIYRSFSGDKVERRGRKLVHGAMGSMFPAIDLLPEGTLLWVRVIHDGTPMRFGLLRRDVEGAGRRVLVIGAREG